MCGIEDWLQSSEEKREWQQVVNLVVRYAFESRPVTIITLAPVAWSIGHSLPNPHELTTNQIRCLVNYIERCSRTLLCDVAEAEEFRRGLLWLSAADPTDNALLLSIVTQIGVESTTPPAPTAEVLLLFDDARRIYWLHASRDLHKLKQEVLNAACVFGWEFRDERQVNC
jgi:hypothetical protein